MHEKLLSYAQRISKDLAKNFKFDIYDADDIEQEIFLLCLDAHGVCDATLIEDEYVFYFNFVRRRLISLKRDKYYNPRNPAQQESKRKLKGPKTEVRPDHKVVNEDQLDEFAEFVTVIDRKIPASYRADWLRLREGIKLSWHVRDKLQKVLTNLVRGYNGEV